MPLLRFSRSALPARPWKNGGGVTREVMCLPEGSDLGQFDWRVSIAHIARSGPFSVFAGIDRVITLLEGPGVRLHTADGAIDHRLDTPLVPFAFPGEAIVQADLLGADCHDFNVMTRRESCTARVQVQRGPIRLPGTREGLLFAVRGSWNLDGPAPLQLRQADGLWWHKLEIAWQLGPGSPDAAMIEVGIDRVTR